MNEIGYTKSWRKKYSGKTAKRGLLYLGAMDWIVGNAAWQDDPDKNEARGEVMTSLSELAEKWVLPIRNVRDILDNLVADEFIEISKTGLRGKGSKGFGTVIKIINYVKYQANSEKSKFKQSAQNTAQNSAQNTAQNKKVVIDEKQTTCDTEKNDSPHKIPHKTFQKAPHIITNKPYKEEEERINMSGHSISFPIVAFPTSAKEVISEATKICYQMTEEKATEFLSWYQSKGWMNGTSLVRDWRKLLPMWKAREAKQSAGGLGNGNQQAGYDRKRLARPEDFGPGVTEF